jgi:hypothetical protein
MKTFGVAILVLVFGFFAFAYTQPSETVRLRCEGVVHYRTDEGERRYDHARLGIEMRRFSQWAFWVEEKQVFDSSLNYFDNSDSQSARQLTNVLVPIERWTDTYIYAEHMVLEGEQVALMMNRLSGYAGFVINFGQPLGETAAMFDGFCEPV